MTRKIETLFALVSVPLIALSPWARADVSAALAYVAPDALEAMEDVADERADLTFAETFDAGVSVEPTVRYVDFLDDEDDGEAAFDAEIAAEFGYTWNEVATLRDEADVVVAQARADLALRRGVERALLAYVDVARAQARVDTRDRQFAARRERIAELEAAVAAGEARPLQVEDARLGLEEAALNRAAAQRDLARARADAVAFGIGSAPRFDPVRFVLPDARPRATLAYTTLALRARAAEAVHRREDVFGTLRSVTASGTYSTADVAFRTEGGIVGGNPHAEVGVDYPSGRDRWSVGVEAEIVFDTSRRDLPGLAARAEEARDELAAYLRAFPERFEARLVEVRAVEARLDIDERRLEVARALAREFAAAAEEADAALATAGEADRADRERDALQASQALRRAQEEEVNALDRLYGSWARYVTQVGDYLELVEGAWAVRE